MQMQPHNQAQMRNQTQTQDPVPGPDAHGCERTPKHESEMLQQSLPSGAAMLQNRINRKTFKLAAALQMVADIMSKSWAFALGIRRGQ